VRSLCANFIQYTDYMMRARLLRFGESSLKSFGLRKLIIAGTAAHFSDDVGVQGSRRAAIEVEEFEG